MDEICGHIESYTNTDTPCNLFNAYACMTTDIVTEYCFGWSKNYSSNRTFLPNPVVPLRALQEMIVPVRHFPWILPIVNSLPDKIVALKMPDTVEWFRMRRRIVESVNEALRCKDEDVVKGSRIPKSIFSEIIKADLPKGEKTQQRLNDEALVFITAGTETTAWSK